VLGSINANTRHTNVDKRLKVCSYRALDIVRSAIEINKADQETVANVIIVVKVIDITYCFPEKTNNKLWKLIL